MGSRYLVCVKNEDEYVIAQYGIDDGAPGTAGVYCMDFGRSLSNPSTRLLFKEKLKNCRFLTEQELADIQNKPEINSNHMTDDAYNIFFHIMKSDTIIHLKNKIAFTGQSLYCEWCYLIDLDLNTFEVFRGFNDIKKNASHRFTQYTEIVSHPRTQYYPVALEIAYSLDNLPDVQDFVNYFNENIVE